jgi:SAM-dependent methyltransferase
MSATDRQRWEARYQQQTTPRVDPCPWLCAQDDRLPREGTALDVAGGAGRNACWLAARGLASTLVDISPTALDLASQAANRRGLPLNVIALDLEEAPLPFGPWSVVYSGYYLNRQLLGTVSESLAPGGWLIFVQPTLRNLERHDRPPAGFLLEEGELPSLVRNLESVRYEECWNETGRHEARLLARRRE